MVGGEQQRSSVDWWSQRLYIQQDDNPPPRVSPQTLWSLLLMTPRRQTCSLSPASAPLLIFLPSPPALTNLSVLFYLPWGECFRITGLINKVNTARRPLTQHCADRGPRSVCEGELAVCSPVSTHTCWYNTPDIYTASTLCCIGRIVFNGPIDLSKAGPNNWSSEPCLHCKGTLWDGIRIKILVILGLVVPF